MLKLIPSIAILIFLLLFVIATILYSGGSDYDIHAHGFSWMHNYWCNLTATIAKNGIKNSAQSVALTAQFILFSGLLIFWIQLPRIFSRNHFYRSISYFGCASMLIGTLSFTPLHNFAIDMAGILGGVAILITLFGLYQHKYFQLLFIGLFALSWLVLNYFMYEFLIGVYYLPLLQKISVFLFLIWVVLMNWKIKSV